MMVRNIKLTMSEELVLETKVSPQPCSDKGIKIVHL